MPSTPWLARKLTADFPNIQFTAGTAFRWSPNTQTIYYKPSGDPAFLLHELGHALLGHNQYTRDITLLSMEREAWEAARPIAVSYNIAIADELVEDAIDTYRNWLHRRSACPRCQATGVQIKPHTYACISCSTSWRPNDGHAHRLYRQRTPLN